MQKVNYFIIALVLFVFGTYEVSAASYTPSANSFESTQTNNLFDMANNQVDNFTNKKYVTFQNGDNYYLVVSDNFNVNSNAVILTSSTVISAIRTSSGSSYYYVYNITTESSTTVNLNYVVISNIKAKNTITGKRFNEYKHNLDLKNIGIFILGLCFAIFVTKERKFV